MYVHVYWGVTHEDEKLLKTWQFLFTVQVQVGGQTKHRFIQFQDFWCQKGTITKSLYTYTPKWEEKEPSLNIMYRYTIITYQGGLLDGTLHSQEVADGHTAGSRLVEAVDNRHIAAEGNQTLL